MNSRKVESFAKIRKKICEMLPKITRKGEKKRERFKI